MATTTTSLKLSKPAYSDTADISVINTNMDTIDTAVSKILPVISGTTNNSGYAISAGEYFEANGSLYKASASIPTGNAWSSSATAQSDHGAINALNSKLTPTYTPITTFYSNRCSNVAAGEATHIMSFGKVHVCTIAVKFLVTPTSSQTSIIAIPSGIPAPSSEQVWGTVYNRTKDKVHTVSISTAGNINVLNRELISTGDVVEGQIVWIA